MTTTAPPSLRSEVLRGGAYLTVRQGAGTAINVAGVVLLTRAIGPGGYGVYAAAIGLFTAVQLIAQMGVGVFLLRADRTLGEEVFRVSSTLLFVAGLVGAALGAITLPLVERWTRIEGLGAIALAVYATLPLSNLAQVPLARLERALDYKRVAWVELAGQLLFFVVALPLAVGGAGAWAPVAGWITQQIVVLVALHRVARYVPRPLWDGGLARAAVRYGAGFTASLWLYQLRKVVNPLIVGRYLGADAVGVVAVTTQIVTHLSFVAVATWRLSMAALARVQHSHDRLRRAVSDGMRLQLLAVAPFLLLFTWVAPFVIPLLLGRAWEEVALIYPFLAVAALANAIFNLHSSTLYVLKHNGEMALFHVAQTALLGLAALALVPRFGVVGYGLAELVALASYGVLHAFTARSVGALASARTLAMGGAIALGLGQAYLGLWSLAALLVGAAILRPWRDLSGLVAELRGMAHE